MMHPPKSTFEIYDFGGGAQIVPVIDSSSDNKTGHVHYKPGIFMCAVVRIRCDGKTEYRIFEFDENAEVEDYHDDALRKNQ